MIIELSNIKSNQELHQIFKEKLGFPDFYGMNWDAFWDGITGLVEMPDQLIVRGFSSLKYSLPRDAEIFQEIVQDYNKLGSNRIVIN